MKSPICDQLDIEFPLIAFTHCRDVVVAVSKSGGMGVLGTAGYNAEQLEIELAWIDEHIDGKPYGVDLIVPTSMANKDEPKTFGHVVARANTHGRYAPHGLMPGKAKRRRNRCPCRYPRWSVNPLWIE